jgi:Zn-dependent M28 family amino/carboxypeptidase
MRKNQKRVLLGLTGLFTLTILAGIIWIVFSERGLSPGKTPPPEFDEQRAYADIEYQLSLGPRTMGSEAHTGTERYIQDVLSSAKWKVEVQDITQDGHPIRNIIAKRGKGSPWIILGAHYDTRFYADRDTNPANRSLPVPGADDGASGVAVLLELSRALPATIDGQVWLVFFDAEDNGGQKGWDWILGSRAFVANLQGKPDAVVVLDMVGDANLDIYMEASSNKALKEEIWQQAASLGYNQFIPTVKSSILDDHTPFLQAGIPAVDVIDINYPYWHTTNDTLDKVSAASLDVVGETILAWLLNYGK